VKENLRGFSFSYSTEEILELFLSLTPTVGITYINKLWYRSTLHITLGCVEVNRRKLDQRICGCTDFITIKIKVDVHGKSLHETPSDVNQKQLTRTAWSTVRGGQVLMGRKKG
jgi:hypothetical protein